MSVTFTCDQCGKTAPPGTATGGLPGGWFPDYIYEKAEGEATKSCTRIDHRCASCVEVQREGQASAQKPDTAAPAKPRRRRAKKA